MEALTPFRRLRVVISPSREVFLRSHHAAVVHALVANAFAMGNHTEPAFPDGWMIDAPEQCRPRLAAGSDYAFGLTLIEPDAQRASQRTARLLEGLRRVAAEPPPGKPVLGGNFTVRRVEDMVAREPWEPGAEPRAVPVSFLADEVNLLRGHRDVVLRFTSPLRMKRPKSRERPYRAFFDESYFAPSIFLRRLYGRLQGLGIDLLEGMKSEETDELLRTALTVTENRLVWLDIAYGPAANPKRFAGCCGKVRFQVNDPAALPLLVWGRLARTGEATRFGFGTWRIEELGKDPLSCHRANPILAPALTSSRLHGRAAEAQLPSGELQAAAARLLAGEYSPAPYRHVSFRQGKKTRSLSIPMPLDMALQRLVLEELGPGIDQFLEDSAYAWRRGIGRHHAARTIKSLYEQGYHYALKSDFRDFYDSIPHGLLEDRLRVYIADDFAVDTIMEWVRAGVACRGRGLPTGAPLSPVLANLFMDRFDEQIDQEGGRLVRYGDDFMILFRKREDAERLFHAARAAAEALCIELNSGKTRALLEPAQPFEFLGFRFQRQGVWRSTPTGVPKPVVQLGWKDVYSSREADGGSIALPGEEAPGRPTRETTVAIGREARRVDARNGRLIAEYEGSRPSTHVPFSRIRNVVLFGAIEFSNSLTEQCLKRGIPVWFLSPGGAPRGILKPTEAGEDGEYRHVLLAAQIEAASKTEFSLEIARQLVLAKVRNYHALTGSQAAGAAHMAAGALASLTGAAEAVKTANTLPKILGHEGAAARVWFDIFASEIGTTRFTFKGRIAPSAEDPINILLNMGYMRLYREAVLALELAHLSPRFGFLHQPRAGHFALASDLQEPFRHLIDRAVLALANVLHAADFLPAKGEERYKLRLRPKALREVTTRFESLFHQRCRDRAGAVRTYRGHLHATARGLAAAIRGNDPRRLVPFNHPPPAAGKAVPEEIPASASTVPETPPLE